MSMFRKHAGRRGLLPPLLAVVVVLAVTLATASLALAQVPQGPSDPVPTGEETGSSVGQESAGASPEDDSPDERDVQKFMDGYVPRQLGESQIPGATVSVVKDGKVVFAKGYGQADVKAGEPVVADETLFRIASTSKLFTATAVMQLAKEGKIDLDRDVNAYLDDVEIPDTYPGRPVTMRHLLTHTAGFEESFTGSLARTADEVDPLGEYLSENVPARVRPPGEVTAYSNYGMSLAGHVVEEVSGQPYDRYLDENVFGPLGMESTTAAQPPAPELRERLATGYEAGEGGPVAGPFEYIEDAPAGVISTTSTDMARFMIAHLNDGSYGGERILDAATAREMRERQFVNAPGLRDGMGLTFNQKTINGERTVQHAGNLIRFHALLTLLPERDVGVFVAYNSYGSNSGGQLAEHELTDAFFDRFYPEERPDALQPSSADAAANAERFAGSYRITRSNQTGFEKVTTLLTGARVVANPDGSLTTRGGMFSSDLAKTEGRWIKTGPATFRAENGDERIAFRQAGGATYLAGEADPTSAYAKLPSYASPRLHLGLLAGGVAVLLLSALIWAVAGAISWWRQRWRQRLDGEPAGKPKVNRPARRARLLASAVAVLVPLFALGMAVVLSNVETALGYGASPLMVGVLSLPVLISVLTAGVMVHAALAWARGYWGLLGRVQYSLVALSALTLVVVMAYYNLIGFQF